MIIAPTRSVTAVIFARRRDVCVGVREGGLLEGPAAGFNPPSPLLPRFPIAFPIVPRPQKQTRGPILKVRAPQTIPPSVFHHPPRSLLPPPAATAARAAAAGSPAAAAAGAAGHGAGRGAAERAHVAGEAAGAEVVVVRAAVPFGRLAVQVLERPRPAPLHPERHRVRQ